MRSADDRRRMGWGARRLVPALMLAAALTPAGAFAQANGPQTNAAAASGPVEITYLALDAPRPRPSTELTPPPKDLGLAGARLALADDATTGRFTGQEFKLDEAVGADAAAVTAAFKARLAAGARNFVTDLPAPLLLALADLPEAQGATLIDATSTDDALRGADCRRNVLHMLPSRAMFADALMQYLVVKNWRHIMLVQGKDPADALYAAAIRHAAKKFQVSIVADKPWSFNAAAQQADTGHFQVNTEVSNLTQGISYDVLVVADEADNFGDQLGYRSFLPRPVAGTQGLTPSAWSPMFDEMGSRQLQLRFLALAKRMMTDRDYGAWLAVRAFGEAATRTASADPAAMATFLHGTDFTVAGYKGPPFSIRPWDGQLRQPVLLADDRSLVSISPQPGFLHQFYETDTLGTDKPETTCHMS